jgi:hypothetical protein
MIEPIGRFWTSLAPSRSPILERLSSATHGRILSIPNSWSLNSAKYGRALVFEGSPSQIPLKVDDEALSWAERYLRMDGQQRRSLDVALDRLNLARRRRSPGDKAIDAGICLEALLGDDSPQELTYKLRLRAALLLGTTLDGRRKIRDDVRDLYDLRSSVVHGRVRRPKDTLLDGQHASRGLEICTQAVPPSCSATPGPTLPHGN